MIQQGADINIQDERGRTCLDYTLENENKSLALYLHKQGGTANIHKSAALKLSIEASISIFRDKTASQKTNDAFQAYLSDLDSKKLK